MIYLDHRFEIDTYDNDFYCGVDPSDSRFFVGRSEVIFNRTTPELLKTEYNIRSLNEERSMEQILLASLKNLRSILHRQVIKYRVIYIKENLLTRQKKNLFILYDLYHGGMNRENLLKSIDTYLNYISHMQVAGVPAEMSQIVAG